MRRCLCSLSILWWLSGAFAFIPLQPHKNNHHGHHQALSRKELASTGIALSSTSRNNDTKIMAIHHHSAQDIAFIQERLKKSFGFTHHNPDEEDKLIRAFEKQTYSAHTNICVQGDFGDYFYILKEGEVKLFVNNTEMGIYSAGDGFGVRALLFDLPQAATVTSTTEVTVWKVSKDLFQNYYHGSIFAKTSTEFEFIENALKFDRVFDSLDLKTVEVDMLIAAFEKVTFQDGEEICVQGEPGDYYYIIQEGLVKFFVNGTEVGMAGEAQTFGELALLYDTPRAATVKAFGGEATLWRVDRSTFRAILGGQTLANLEAYTKRTQLKKQLEEAAILQFSHDGPEHYCEDIMEELEKYRPIANPAYHCSMNGDWCMVKAGTSTIDMAVIQLLSEISKRLPIVDFVDVHITLSDNASLVTANVFLKLFGIFPITVNCFTTMTNDDNHPEGIRMYEKFNGLQLFGIRLTVPPSLVEPRPLDITFLDGDIMIARNPTSGGEPHLLIRIRNNPEEDPDHKYTGFFEDARLLYGDRITRHLVDRQWGDDSEGGNQDLSNLLDAVSRRTRKVALDLKAYNS